MIICLAAFPFCAGRAAGDPPAVEGSLTLETALALVAEHNTALKASALDVGAADARARQAGLPPNPEIEAGVENIGNKNLEGLDGKTSTFLAGQRLEVAGKRPKRRDVALQDKALAGWDYEMARLDLLVEAKKAFADILAAQARLTVAEDIVSLSQQVYAAVSARVAGGKVSPVEETKSKVALASSRLERSKRALETDAARKRLAALWGETFPAFERAEGSFESASALPSFDQIISKLDANPDILRWGAERKQREAVLRLEKAMRIPDPTLGAGMRRFDLGGENSYMFSISLPIPLFDRNQGAIREAQIRLEKAGEEERAVRLDAASRLAQTYAGASSSYEEIRVLQGDVLPSAQSVFDSVSEGYRLGKFGYLDVLDAQRTLIEAKFCLVDALAAYHGELADLQRLLGASIEQLSALDATLCDCADSKGPDSSVERNLVQGGTHEQR
jgi:cobalt-zinc-cadmium efflux system outer membrane protein